MSIIEEIQKSLDVIGEQVGEVNASDDTLGTLAEKTLKLWTQIIVHQTLLNTARDLGASDESPGPKTAPARIKKVFKSTFGKPNREPAERWRKLRKLDIESFLYIAIFYIDLELFKLD